MNTKTHLIILLLMISFSINAQTSVGLKTHFGTAWQEYGTLPINGYDQRIDGYGVAIEIIKELSPRFRVKANPGFVRRGAACEPGFLFFDPITPGNLVPFQDATLYSNYIEFPIRFNAKWSLANRLSLFVESGAGIAYMISGYRTIQFFDNRPNMDQKLDFDNETTLNRYDFGAHAGLGLNYEVGRGYFHLSGEYYHGFMDVTDTNTSKNRSLSIGLGYVVRLK